MRKPETSTHDQAPQQDDADKMAEAPATPVAEADTAESEASTEDAEDSCNSQQAEINVLKDKYIRLSAEFDNYRKRTIREKADMLKFASEDTLRDMLPVVDDLERAAQAVQTATDVESLKQGISLIVNKFHEFMKAKGVREIECMGQPLDTDLHEAISKIPAPDPEQKGKIIDVVQKGYTINDKVMRFAKVVVAD